MVRAIEKNMKDIFRKVQYNKIDHPQYTKQLMKLYEKVSPNHIMFLLEYFDVVSFCNGSL